MKKQGPRYKAGETVGPWKILAYAGRSTGKKGHTYHVMCKGCGKEYTTCPQSHLNRAAAENRGCHICEMKARSGEGRAPDANLYMNWISDRGIEDWQLITIQLRRKFGSNAKVAKAIGDVSPSWIANMAAGRAPEPRYGVGQRMKRLLLIGATRDSEK